MKIRTARDIGILIKEARTRRGLSQAALAKMINTTQTWVSWIENGKPSAEIGNVLLALTTLGVELDFQIPSAPTSVADHPNADERHVDDDEIPYKL
ncbi:helix-turn-helix domain-containing protein [Aminobacter sp. DSM 101952]|uniref:helix-turn-helix domain-containing protein n=1 Tax=Aminobacter sp. DSM 101952 TaxID=2735891 RepID=UPI0009E936AA|nr:helix-turn-helix domain-containing protein [Aminobacter sp. DSM 101952]